MEKAGSLTHQKSTASKAMRMAMRTPVRTGDWVAKALLRLWLPLPLPLPPMLPLSVLTLLAAACFCHTLCTSCTLR